MPKHSPPPKEIQGNNLPTGKAPAPPEKKKVIDYKSLYEKYGPPKGITNDEWEQIKKDSIK